MARRREQQRRLVASACRMEHGEDLALKVGLRDDEWRAGEDARLVVHRAEKNSASRELGGVVPIVRRPRPGKSVAP